MIVIDANVLIYAYNPASAEHDQAKRWLESAFTGHVPVRIPWVSILAFVRIMTNAQAFRRPLSLHEAVGHVDEWFAQPNVAPLEPTERHWTLLREQLLQGQATGPLVTDAHIAALAIEHGAAVHTADRDFARFPAVKSINPLK